MKGAVMLAPDLFEELLATYPAERRELARQVYHRFAEGDSTQFFTQLFLLLDVYAHYAERVPQAVVQANQSAHANFVKFQEEIALLAQAMDKRNLNIANHAEKTDELCEEAVTKCNETIGRFEALLKNIGSQVDTKAIVDGINAELQNGIRDKVIRPFIEHTQELSRKVVPTLEEIQSTSREARTLWTRHVWRTAWASVSLVLFTVFGLATTGVYVLFKNHTVRETAMAIADVDRLMRYNQEAFRQLAIAKVPIEVVRTTNTNGVINPGGFALMVENADAAEMRQVGGHNNGLIFFSSHATEELIQQMEQEMKDLTNRSATSAK